MGKFFTVEVKPDVIAGDVSVHQNASTKAAVDIGVRALIFDWTEVLIPRGGCMLRSVNMIINGEDGAYAAAALVDYDLHFARTYNGVAPTTLGAIGASQTACFDYRDHYMGSVLVESASGAGSPTGPSFHIALYSDSNGSGAGLPMVFDFGDESINAGYDKLYVSGNQLAARHYNTGVIVNGAITSDTETTITVDGVAATKIFSVGDTVYLHDVDTALGTIKSLTDTTITLNAAIAGGTDLADDDELLNANPITIRLGFEM
jgi:hypothetical protein